MCIRFLIHHPFDYDPLVFPSLIWNRVKILNSNKVIQYCNKWRLKFPLFFLCICFWKIGNYNINTHSLGKKFSSVLYRVIIVTVSDLFRSPFQVESPNTLYWNRIYPTDFTWDYLILKSQYGVKSKILSPRPITELPFGVKSCNYSVLPTISVVKHSPVLNSQRI